MDERPQDTPWAGFIEEAMELTAHDAVRVPKAQVPHPKDAGFRRSLGQWHGQRADYRAGLEGGRGLHVLVFKDRYEIHWDQVDPHRDPLGHLIRDSPRTLVSSLIVGVAAGLLWLR